MPSTNMPQAGAHQCLVGAFEQRMLLLGNSSACIGNKLLNKHFRTMKLCFVSKHLVKKLGCMISIGKGFQFLLKVLDQCFEAL